MSKKSTKSSDVPLLLVQEFLLNHSFADLHKEHGVKFRPSACGRKVSLNYDMIEAHDSNKIAQQCRGLILAKADNCVFSGDQEVVGETYIVARPFDRFFNLGQDAAAKIDFTDPQTSFFEKLDGSLIICYFDHYQDKWHVGTRAVCEADLPVDGYGEVTFRDLFFKALVASVPKIQNYVPSKNGVANVDLWFNMNMNRSNTYMFELCTEQNIVVVKHKGYNLYLLGVRNTESGKEYPVSDFVDTTIPIVPQFKLSSLEDMVNFVSDRDPSTYEGIVACDSKYRRVKCKNAGYMALGRVKDSAMKSPRGLMQIILMEKMDDVIPLLPDFAVARANVLADGYRTLIHNYQETYDKVLKIANEESPIFNPESKSLIKQHQKSFAQAVQACGGWMAPMMEQYHGKNSGLHDYVLRRRNIAGDWPNGFLDSVIEMIDKTLKESN